MGGIINYYHGEEGVAAKVHHEQDGDRLLRCIELLDNPHRSYAFDYGADVFIDPRIACGDPVRFARLTPYDGVWVREHDFEAPYVVEAAVIAAKIRNTNQSPNRVIIRLPDVWTEEAPSFEGISYKGVHLSDRPATEASFFVSYSSKNVLLARAIVRDLRYDTRLDVWLDLEQEVNAADWPRQRAERWLREGVYSSKGLLLLLTDAAARSEWVKKELAWARERSHEYPSFRFIVLKLADVSLPENLPRNSIVIDGAGVWAINGINEELIAAVLGREGRRTWKQRNPNTHENPIFPEQPLSYRDFESTAGIALRLEKLDTGWILEYEDNGRRITIEQAEQSSIIDPGIRCGDQIASFVCNRNRLVRFWPGYRFWMRSADLNLEPENVAAEFMHVIGEKAMPSRFTR